MSITFLLCYFITLLEATPLPSRGYVFEKADMMGYKKISLNHPNTFFLNRMIENHHKDYMKLTLTRELNRFSSYWDLTLQTRKLLHYVMGISYILFEKQTSNRIKEKHNIPLKWESVWKWTWKRALCFFIYKKSLQ